jgi:hypothetical protein
MPSGRRPSWQPKRLLFLWVWSAASQFAEYAQALLAVNLGSIAARLFAFGALALDELALENGHLGEVLAVDRLAAAGPIGAAAIGVAVARMRFVDHFKGLTSEIGACRFIQTALAASRQCGKQRPSQDHDSHAARGNMPAWRCGAFFAVGLQMRAWKTPAARRFLATHALRDLPGASPPASLRHRTRSAAGCFAQPLRKWGGAAPHQRPNGPDVCRPHGGRSRRRPWHDPR